MPSRLLLTQSWNQGFSMPSTSSLMWQDEGKGSLQIVIISSLGTTVKANRLVSIVCRISWLITPESKWQQAGNPAHQAALALGFKGRWFEEEGDPLCLRENPVALWNCNGLSHWCVLSTEPLVTLLLCRTINSRLPDEALLMLLCK